MKKHEQQNSRLEKKTDFFGGGNFSRLKDYKINLSWCALAVALCFVTTAIYGQSTEKASLPLNLDGKWTVYLNVDPETFLQDTEKTIKSFSGKKIQPVNVEMKKAGIDLAALNGDFAKGYCAVIRNEFISPKKGTMQCGASADWWMEIYVNGEKVYSTMSKGNDSTGSFKTGDHTFVFPVKAGKNSLLAKVKAGSQGWRFLCGIPGYKPESDGKRPNVKFASPAWKPVNISNLLIQKGSALDQSGLWIPPRDSDGKLCRLTIGPTGRLVAEGKPTKAIRLKGYTFWIHCIVPQKWPVSKPSMDNEALERLLEGSRTQGYNFLRLWLADMPDNSKYMGKTDFLLNKMGEKGIYMHLMLFIGRKLFKHDSKWSAHRNDLKAKMYLGDPFLRKVWKSEVETLLNHVNPYTGLAWKDDPTIACVEFYNEQEGGLLWGGVRPETINKFSARFRIWLKAKYKTLSALRDAWRDSSVESFEKIEVPKDLLRGILKDAKGRDFTLLCNELTRDCATWYEETLRSIGYKGLVGQYDIPVWMGNIEARFEKSQVALTHNYFRHPSHQFYIGSRCGQDSSISGAASYWRAANASRFPDRPLFVTEFNHTFWNPYQYECGIVFGAYSALQGFDALVIHDKAVELSANDPKWSRLDCWSVGRNPVSRAGEFLSACLYLRGDVKPSAHRVELEIPKKLLAEKKAVSTEQSKIGLLCGFSVNFPWAKRPSGLPVPPKPDLSILPSVGSEIGVSTGWSVDLTDTNDSRFSIVDFTKTLKMRGILPKDNISDPVNGIFQSDTREITMRVKEKLLKVVTLHSEAITLDGGKGEMIKLLDIVNTSVPACIAACSVDGRKLQDSRRVVIIYSTEAANTDMELSADRRTLIKQGRMPILMKTGHLVARLKNSNAGKLSLYALELDGSRCEKLALSVVAGGISFSLDTAALKNGPTPFFELVVE